VSNSEIDTNERRLQISKVFENPLFHFQLSNDPFDISVYVHVNFDINHIIQLVDQGVNIIENSVLNMEVPLISLSEKYDPIINLKWNDNIPTECKNEVVFEVEMKELPIEFKDLNETEIKNKEENKDEKEEEKEEQKENEKEKEKDKKKMEKDL